MKFKELQIPGHVPYCGMTIFIDNKKVFEGFPRELKSANANNSWQDLQVVSVKSRFSLFVVRLTRASGKVLTKYI